MLVISAPFFPIRFLIFPLVMMKKDFDDNFLKKSDEFIKISLSSGKAKHRELYNMLPEQTKMLIKKVFGNNELHVDEKLVGSATGITYRTDEWHFGENLWPEDWRLKH